MSFPRPITGRTVPFRPATARAWRLVCNWFLAAVAVFALLLAAGPVFGQETRSRGESSGSASIHGTMTTLQENTTSGLAGVVLKLAPGPDGGAVTAGAGQGGGDKISGVPPRPGPT